MLQQLRNLNIDRIDLDEAIVLATWARAASNGYTFYEVPAPQWLADAIASLDGEIRRRRMDLLQARLREIEAREQALKSREERRADLEAEKAKIRVQLGI